MGVNGGSAPTLQLSATEPHALPTPWPLGFPGDRVNPPPPCPARVGSDHSWVLLRWTWPLSSSCYLAEGSPASLQDTPGHAERVSGQDQILGNQSCPWHTSMVPGPAPSLRSSLPSLRVPLCAIPTAVPPVLPRGGLWGAQPHLWAAGRGEQGHHSLAPPSAGEERPPGQAGIARPRFRTHLGAAARPCIGSRAAPPARPSTWA